MKRLAAVRSRQRQLKPPPLCYRTTLTGRSTFGTSSPLRPVSLKTNWLLGLNGVKRDVLDGRTSPVAFLALGVTSCQPGKA